MKIFTLLRDTDSNTLKGTAVIHYL